MEKCLICEKGHLKKIMNREVIYGVYLGDFPAKKCSFCNEIWTDGETMEKIEKVAKEKGVWGLGVKNKYFNQFRQSRKLSLSDKIQDNGFKWNNRITARRNTYTKRKQQSEERI